jgi:hypothetical protein
MAEILEEYPWGHRGSQYPWTEWLDGQIRRLERGEGKDFTCTPQTLRASAYKAGKLHDKAVRGACEGTNYLVLQAYGEASANA